MCWALHHTPCRPQMPSVLVPTLKQFTRHLDKQADQSFENHPGFWKKEEGKKREELVLPRMLRAGFLQELCLADH